MVANKASNSKKKTLLDFVLESDQIDGIEININEESIVKLEQGNVRILKMKRIFKGQLEGKKVAKDNQLQSKQREGVLYAQV